MTSPPVNPYSAPKAPQGDRKDRKDWKTWSPFQSHTVRDICAHMTPEEKSAVVRRGFLYGIWVVISVALPVQLICLGLAMGNLNLAVAIVGGLSIIAHLICIPVWQRHQRQFLCRTVWARQNDISPDGLKLFTWSRRTDSP